MLKKDEVKQIIQSKVFDLCRKNDKLLLINSRLFEINNLIKINKKSENLTVTKMGKTETELDFSANPQNLKQKRNASAKLRRQEAEITRFEGQKIQIPFFVYPLRNQAVVYNLEDANSRKRRLTIRSKYQPTLYQDFEVLKKLQSTRFPDSQ